MAASSSLLGQSLNKLSNCSERVPVKDKLKERKKDIRRFSILHSASPGDDDHESAEVLEGYDDVDFLDSGDFIGPRDVLIFVSHQDESSSTGKARKQGQFFYQDVDKMISEGIPKESWNDEAKIMKSRFMSEKDMFKRKRNIDVVVQIESQPNLTVGMAVNSILNMIQKRSINDKMKGGKNLHFVKTIRCIGILVCVFLVSSLDLRYLIYYNQ